MEEKSRNNSQYLDTHSAIDLFQIARACVLSLTF